MNFWANKLAGTTPPPTSALPRSLFSHEPVQVPQTFQPAPQEQQYTPTARLIQGSTCPGCGSDKYRGSVGSYAVACPICGYHPRFEQTGYGVPSLATEPGAVTPARQVQGSQTMKGAIAALNAGGGERI